MGDDAVGDEVVGVGYFYIVDLFFTDVFDGEDGGELDV